MKVVVPGRALRYNPNSVGDISKVLAPPYDVISPNEQAALYAVHPANVIRIILGLETPDDNESDNKYTRARDTLRSWIKDGIIAKDDREAFYVYDQVFNLPDGRTVTRRGIIGRLYLDDGGCKLLAHERTLDGPKQDRFKLFQTTHVICSQVFAFYSDPEQRVEALLSAPGIVEPLVDGTTPDQIRHILGRVVDPVVIDAISEELSGFTQYIADGHHRCETTLNYRNHRIGQVPNPTGEEPFNFATVYMANTCQEGLVILPINRLIHDVADFDSAKLLLDLSADCDISLVDGDVEQVNAILPSAGKDGTAFAIMLPDNVWRIVRVRPTAKTDFIENSHLHHAVADLDVSWIHQRMLNDMLGITPQAQAAKTNIDYQHDPREVEAMFKAGRDRYQLAILMNPVSAEQIQAVAVDGERMPQKSTYFYPKIISGLVIHPLEDDI